jgi:hypothetical protein
MPIKDYLQKREIQIILIVAALSTILVLHQVGAFIVYGIPAVTFHTVTQTKPVSKSITILNSYGDWVAYEYTCQGEGYKGGLGWDLTLLATLHVTLKVKVETTDLMLSGFLTEIKPPPFLIEETETTIYYKNMTIHSYAYGFKITLAWSGSAYITVDKWEKGGLLPLPPTAPSKESMMKELAQTILIPDFNKNYLIAADLILMSIDAPTLATDKTYELRPDYLGIGGMWLTDYKTIGYTTGTATEALPASPGTAVKLFRDKALTDPCWTADYDTPMGKPLLTPDVVYWLDHFAPPAAWWKISIVNLGSQLVYDETKAYPDYISWAWEKYPVDQDGDGKTDVPAVAQWFRVDLVFRVTKDWTVPKIPEYEMPPEEKAKMKIIVTAEPENKGVPLNPPSQETWFSNLSKLIPIFIIIFVGTIVTIIVYYYAKGKWGVTKA